MPARPAIVARMVKEDDTIVKSDYSRMTLRQAAISGAVIAA
jgi:hypothetical protein